MRRAVAYLRVSTDKQPLSIADQRREILAWCQKHAVTIVRWYTDDAISGATADNRDSFQLLVVELEQLRDAELVLCYNVSRFGRTGSDEAGFYRHRLWKAGAEVVYLAESALNGSETDELLLPVLQFQQREYLRGLSRDTLRGLVGIAKRGAWCGGPAPFGYVRELRAPDGRPLRKLARGEHAQTEDGSAVFLVPGDPADVEAVRDVWRARWVDGASFDKIRDRLTALGVQSARARPWQISAARVIVTNPVYTGRATYGLRTDAKFHRIDQGGAIVARGRRESGSHVQDPHAQPIVVEGAHEPLAPPEAVEAFLAWEAADLARRRRGDPQVRENGRQRWSPFLLSGLMTCARCGSSWNGQTRRKGDHAWADYLCSGYSRCGAAFCSRFAIPRDELEGWVIEEIDRMWGDAADGDAIARRIRIDAGGASRSSGESVRRQIRLLDERLIAVASSIDPEHAELANAAIVKLKRQRAELAKKLELTLGEEESEHELEQEVAEAVALVQSFRAIPKEASIEKRKAVVRSFVGGLTVDPRDGKLALELWQFPKRTTASRGVQRLSAGRGILLGVAGGHSDQETIAPSLIVQASWARGVGVKRSA